MANFQIDSCGVFHTSMLASRYVDSFSPKFSHKARNHFFRRLVKRNFNHFRKTRFDFFELRQKFLRRKDTAKKNFAKSHFAELPRRVVFCLAQIFHERKREKRAHLLFGKMRKFYVQIKRKFRSRIFGRNLRGFLFLREIKGIFFRGIFLIGSRGIFFCGIFSEFFFAIFIAKIS